MANWPVFYRLSALTLALASGFLMMAPASALAMNDYGWRRGSQRESVRVYSRQTVIVRTYGRGNDHNRDALTNAALLKQSILLSRSAASGDQCAGGVSKNSNCMTRGGARVVSVSGSRPSRADR
jgi:hypothetical protein